MVKCKMKLQIKRFRQYFNFSIVCQKMYPTEFHTDALKTRENVSMQKLSTNPQLYSSVLKETPWSSGLRRSVLMQKVAGSTPGSTSWRLQTVLLIFSLARTISVRCPYTVVNKLKLKLGSLRYYVFQGGEIMSRDVIMRKMNIHKISIYIEYWHRMLMSLHSMRSMYETICVNNA